MNDSKLTFYSNHGTPFGNLVEAFLKTNDISYDRKIVNVVKGEGQKPEYLKISPLGKIPAIVEEDGYSLAESGAILKYLCSTRNLKDSYYPKDIKKRGHVDAYYDFFTQGVNTLVFDYTRAYLTKQADKVEEISKKVTEILDKIIKNFMKENKFVASNDEPTIADFTTVYIVEFTRGLVKTMTVSEEFSSYIDRVNSAFPKIQEQMKLNIAGIIETLVSIGMAKAEDFQ